MNTFLKRYPLSLIIVGAIWYLSFFTPPQTELNEITNIDKLAHICMYGGLCSVIWFEYLRSHKELAWKKLRVGVILLPILMSGTIELMQNYLTTNRGGEWWDFAANITGVILATVLGYYILRPLLWKQKGKEVK